MKIGILTYHRCHNYGALLQAIGLREYLKDRGHEVYFVDYWPDYHSKEYKAFRSYSFRKTRLKSLVRGVVEDVCFFPLKIRRIRKFNRFIDSYIAPYCVPLSEKLDCMVCGSDQIWRKNAGLGGKFDPVFFGEGEFNSGFFISYAASTGEISLSQTEEEILKALLANFRALSVREGALLQLLEKIGVDKEVCMVADPTILLGSDRWSAFISGKPRLIKEDYVLYYKLADNAFDESRIRRFASERGLRMVLLEGRIRNNDYFNGSITDADPMEMLNLIANASYVFTSSYHGLVFSLLFCRQVYCAFTRNSVRAESLLDVLGIPERLLSRDAGIPDGKIDYGKVAPLLARYGAESGQWLDRALAGC